MHKTKKVVLLLLLSSITLGSDAQMTYSFLKRGDTMPNVELKFVGNDTKSLKLSDYKGKMVIFDFWGVGCLSCMDAIPKMEKLQAAYSNELQIILVTKDNLKQVKDIQKVFKTVRNTKLPMVVADTILSAMFPSTSLGLHAWIDQNRNVRQVVSGNTFTNQDNIEKYFIDTSFTLPQIKYEQMDYADEKPLWWGNNVQQLKHLKYYSLFAGKIDYSGSGYRSAFDSVTKKLIWFKAHNICPLLLFQKAFAGYKIESAFNYQNRWILEVHNQDRYNYPTNPAKNEEWCEDNCVTYELQVPVDRSEDIFDIMQDDLKRFFNLNVIIEKQKRRCLVLIIKKGNASFMSTGGNSFKRATTDNKYTFKNVPMVEFGYFLGASLQYNSMPFIDKTNYPKSIDIELSGEIQDIENLKKQLNRFGLDLIERDEEIEMFIIKGKR